MEKNKKIIIIAILAIISIVIFSSYNSGLLKMGSIIDDSEQFEDVFDGRVVNFNMSSDEETKWDCSFTGLVGWNGYVKIVSDGAPYRYTLKVFSMVPTHTQTADSYKAQAKNAVPFESTYWSFVSADKEGHTYPSTHEKTYLKLYDVDNNLLISKDVTALAETYDEEDLWELIHTSGEIDLYINGEFNMKLCDSDVPIAYIEFYTWTNMNNTWDYWEYWIIDSVSTTGNTIGLGTEEFPEHWINKNSNSEIDVDWTVRTIDPYANWNDSTYEMKVKYLGTDEIINTSILNITKPCGIEVFDRDTLFGEFDYGMYEFYITKDGHKLAKEYLEFVPIGESPTYSDIIIDVNSNIEATIDDEDGSGSLTNSYGNVHLTPLINIDDIYPITIDLNETSTEVILSFNAEGTVVATPLTISGLDTSKPYTVYLNNVEISTSENETYQYNLTSHSNDVLKLAQATVTTPSSGGGGSSYTPTTIESITPEDTELNNPTSNINSSISYTDVISNNNGWGYLIGCIIVTLALIYYKKK